VPGSLVFQPARESTWTTIAPGGGYVPGAQWRLPEGPASYRYTRARDPVTHVAHADAEAFDAINGMGRCST
jgi:sulfatase modifying factor 1